MQSSLFTAALTLGLAGVAVAQNPRYSFSIEWRNPTIAMPDPATGIPITEGDILAPSTGPYPFAGNPRLGPLFTPTVLIPHSGPGSLGLAPGFAGHPPGTMSPLEVDAFTLGVDLMAMPNGFLPGEVRFSVDEFAFGMGASPLPPTLVTEAPPGESSADTFLYPILMPPGPLPPFASPPMNFGTIDGDGYGFFTGLAYPGSGLFEPNPPIAGPLSIGDNLDALDVADPGPGAPIPLFSLDSAIFDPLAGVPGSGSAAAYGFVGGDILTPGPVGPLVWAPALALGLDRLAGPDSDDLDALAVWENGDGLFQPSFQPFDWLAGGHDMVLFSVRRGSALIGAPDSIFGIPIEPGDILTTPLLGGASPFPGIFIAAENLDLATIRGGISPFGDEVDAFDLVGTPLLDCDNNGIEDSVDVFNGAVDANGNGVPDICEIPSIGTPYCFCTLPVSACGNAFNFGGCINVTGAGAILSGTGSASVAADNLVLTTSGLTPMGFVLTFMGNFAVPPVIVQNGILCANGSNFRFPPYPTLGGIASIGPGMVGLSVALNPPPGHITPGTTWHFQSWYRDIGGPCGGFSNLSNALSVTFFP